MPTLFRFATLAALLAIPLSASAQTQAPPTPARSLEAAQLRLRLYVNVERPAERRRLDADIRLAEARVASLKRLLAEYAPMDRFTTGRALVLTIEGTRLDLLAAELDLKELRAQRWDLDRAHADRLRLLQLEVAEAAGAR